MQPGKILFEAIQNLLEIIQVKNVYLVAWQGHMDTYILKSFYNMKNTATINQTAIQRIYNNTTLINLSGKDSITISPLSKNIKYRKVTYPALCVECDIDNKNLKIYSAKCNSLINLKIRRKNDRGSSCSCKPRISTY